MTRDKKIERLTEEVRFHAQYAEVVLNSIADGVYSTDLNRIIKTWSRGAEEITGWKAEEIIGHPCFDFLKHTDDMGRVLCDVDCPIVQTFRTGRNTAKEASVLTKDGRRIPVSITVGPIFDESGNVIGAVEVFRDISKERELLESIKRANALKDQFLANVSHELRTPLNSIIGFSELLKEQVIGPLNEKQLQYVQNILQSGEHLLSLINDILDLSKVEAGTLEVESVPINLKEVLQWGLFMQKERAKKHNISLNLDVDGEIGVVRTDPTRLKQILFNLLSNAVKFTPDGGSVSVKAKKLNGEIQISVSDNGIGIPKDRIDDIFEPFVQLDSSLSRQYEGTGLGLALTRRLVELLGGRIWVESQLGKGSTFHFTIPVELEKGKNGERRSIKIPIPKGKKVSAEKREKVALIVEDDLNFASLLREYLEDLGCRTAIALSGEEGLRIARQLKPDLITLDIMMPVMDGWQFLEKLNEDEELRGTPVVIISVLHEEGKGMTLGASAVLQKPIDRTSLMKALERAGLSKKEQAKVLVVDDDPNAVEVVSETLSSMGYTVLKAYSGREGVQIAMDETPDLIVLDLMMPEMSGFDTIEHLKSDPKTRDIPIVILTAKLLTDEDIRRLNGHIVSITRKGEFSEEEFLREVRNALGGNFTRERETKYGKDSGGRGPRGEPPVDGGDNQADGT